MQTNRFPANLLKDIFTKLANKSNKSSSALVAFLEASFTQNRAPKKKTQAGGVGGNFEIEKSIKIFSTLFLLSLKYCSRKIKTMKLHYFLLNLVYIHAILHLCIDLTHYYRQ